MAIARYKDLCIDTSAPASASDTRDLEETGRFWAAALGLSFEPDGAAGALTGRQKNQRVWMNVVPEPKTAKHRVHIDVLCATVDELLALGATMLEPAEEFGRGWSVMADPEGGEFCAFVRPPEQLTDYRLYEINVDCRDPQTVATWWADVLGAKVGGDVEHDWWWLESVPGLPFEDWVFVSVPEPKTAKNRIHWDVRLERPNGVDALVEAGALVLRPPTADDRWHVMADPEGNEFCAFAPAS